MEISNILAILAVLISIGGLIYAKKSFHLSKSIQDKTNEMEIDIQKNELLQIISNNKQLLNKSSIDLGALKADFEVEPQPIKTLMSEQIKILKRNQQLINL